MLFKNSNEGYDRERLTVKQTIDDDWFILMNTNEWYDPSWLSLKNDCSWRINIPETKRQIWSWMTTDETNDWPCATIIHENKLNDMVKAD